MWKEYSLPVGADGFAARGHTLPRIPLSRAKARFFTRVYDGALTKYPTSRGTLIQNRDLLRGFEIT